MDIIDHVAAANNYFGNDIINIYKEGQERPDLFLMKSIWGPTYKNQFINDDAERNIIPEIGIMQNFLYKKIKNLEMDENKKRLKQFLAKNNEGYLLYFYYKDFINKLTENFITGRLVEYMNIPGYRFLRTVPLIT